MTVERRMARDRLEPEASVIFILLYLFINTGHCRMLVEDAFSLQVG